MKAYKLTIKLLVASFVLVSCNDDQKKFFEDERYEKMMYIVSDYTGVHNLVYDLERADDGIRNVVIACSGTNPTVDPATIVLGEDTVLFNKFNYVNFVEDSARFAIQLPKESYAIPQTEVEYPAGAPRVLVPVHIDLSVVENLDPDKIYFIPVAIESAAPYKLVKDKGAALLQIHKKNKYGNTAIPVEYNASGYEGVGYHMSTKILVPLTHNQVRMFIGAKKLPAEVEKRAAFIQKNSVIIEVAPDNTLIIKPYNPKEMTVETLSASALHPGDGAYALYDNRLIEETTIFGVYYRYKMNTGGWTEIREIIRLPIINVE